MLVLFWGLVGSAGALQRGGVDFPDTITTEQDQQLLLNGAGIRKKLFFSIYVAALYLEKPTADPLELVEYDGRKRMLMHFLYDSVEREKLITAWEEGFVANTEAAELADLESAIKTFTSLFVDMVKGERILLDYSPGLGTAVVIKGEEVGVIPGKGFNDALLRIWLGSEPVTPKLKAQLLGGTTGQ
jgi:hypothetical protein